MRHDIVAADIYRKYNHRGIRAGSSECAQLFDITQQVSSPVAGLGGAGAKILQLREALDQSQREKQEHGKASEPMRNGGVGGGAAYQEPDRIQTRQYQYIHQRNTLQVERVSQRTGKVHEQPAEEKRRK